MRYHQGSDTYVPFDVIPQNFKHKLGLRERKELNALERAIVKVLRARHQYRKQQDRSKQVVGDGSIDRFIESTVRTICADRRDKGYAILSLVSQVSVREKIGVDYTIDVATLTVRVLKALPDSTAYFSIDTLKGPYS